MNKHRFFYQQVLFIFIVYIAISHDEGRQVKLLTTPSNSCTWVMIIRILIVKLNLYTWRRDKSYKKYNNIIIIIIIILIIIIMKQMTTSSIIGYSIDDAQLTHEITER